jgi:hypothetical protein
VVAKQTTSGAGGSLQGSKPRRSATASGEHWKRLLRAPPKAVPISVDEFVDELNRRLFADSCYQEDTRFVVMASDDGRPGGTTWEGPESMKPVVSRIVKTAVVEYDVGVPFYADR